MELIPGGSRDTELPLEGPQDRELPSGGSQDRELPLEGTWIMDMPQEDSGAALGGAREHQPVPFMEILEHGAALGGIPDPSCRIWGSSLVNSSRGSLRIPGLQLGLGGQIWICILGTALLLSIPVCS